MMVNYQLNCGKYQNGKALVFEVLQKHGSSVYTVKGKQTQDKFKVGDEITQLDDEPIRSFRGIKRLSPRKLPLIKYEILEEEVSMASGEVMVGYLPITGHECKRSNKTLTFDVLPLTHQQIYGNVLINLQGMNNNVMVEKLTLAEDSKDASKCNQFIEYLKQQEKTKENIKRIYVGDK